jgi:hypothetical protein
MTILMGIIFGFIYGFYISISGIFKPQMLAMTEKKSHHYGFVSRIILTAFLIGSFTIFVIWCVISHHSILSYNLDSFFICLGIGLLIHVGCYIPVMIFCCNKLGLFYWLEKALQHNNIQEISQWLEEHTANESMINEAYQRFCDHKIFCQVWKSFSLKRTIELKIPDSEHDETETNFIKI